MLYSELETIIIDTIQSDDDDTFAENIPSFVRMAEDTIYRAVQLPAMTESAQAETADSGEYLTTPGDFKAPLTVSIRTDDEYIVLIQKDVSWLLAAFPSLDSADDGVPRYYAMTDENTIRFRPIPDDAYAVELEYSCLPESLVDVDDDETTWVSRHMRVPLVYGALMHAANFIHDYEAAGQFEKSLLTSLGLTKLEQEGKARTDRARGEYQRPKP